MSRDRIRRHCIKKLMLNPLLFYIELFYIYTVHNAITSEVTVIKVIPYFTFQGKFKWYILL